MSSGYAGQFRKLPFDELSSDPARDPIWVVIKNPKTLPPQALVPSDLSGAETDEEGKPKNLAAAITGGNEVAARLIVAWRAYDTTTAPQFDELTGEVIDGTSQELLPPPTGGKGVHPDQFARLPRVIQEAIFKEITEAGNPPGGQGAPTPKTSSGQPSPSTTAPGEATPSPPSSPTTS